VESFAAYGALLGILYALWGPAVLRYFWFPIVYLALILPPPETLVTAVTQPIKIAISSTAVDLLYMLGYPIASSGVTIQIAQYELLVAAACAGMNSIISLTAIGLFYVYVLHNANYRYAGLLLLAILPAAIFANFVRVLILILVTYHFGDAAAQGFIHNFAGVTMFFISLVAILSIDKLASPLRKRLSREPAHHA
jgi:exosortase